MLPGDAYQQIDRIVKYGVLVVGLTFATIFVVGLLRATRAHMVQYLLVGCSHLPVLSADALARRADPLPLRLCHRERRRCRHDRALSRPHGGAARGTRSSAPCWPPSTPICICCCRWRITCCSRGTIGLLVALALVMYATRNVDWFAIGLPRLGQRLRRQWKQVNHRGTETTGRESRKRLPLIPSFPRKRESRAPSAGLAGPWIPAFAGMTTGRTAAVGPSLIQRRSFCGNSRQAKFRLGGRASPCPRPTSFRFRSASPATPGSTRPTISGSTTQSIADPEKLLGRAGQAAALDQALHQGQGRQLSRRRPHPLVRGRHAERLGQLPRPASRHARRPDGDHLGRRQPERAEAHQLWRGL